MPTTFTRCQWCWERPATVFTPTMPLCRVCKAEHDRLEAEDNPVPNAPTCPTCGDLLDAKGCARCDVASFSQFARTVVPA